MLPTHPEQAPVPCLRCVGVEHARVARHGQAGLDLQLNPGELLAVTGPSGSGKTSLLRVLAGVDAPQAGEVWLDSHPTWALPARGPRPGLIGPHHRPRPELTVLQNLRQSWVLPGERGDGSDGGAWNRTGAGTGGGSAGDHIADAPGDAGVEAALAATGLTGLAGVRAAELDQAAAHRLILARELAAGPSLLLLDDPYRDAGAEVRSALSLSIAAARAQLGTSFVYAARVTDEVTATATSRLELGDLSAGTATGSGDRMPGIGNGSGEGTAGAGPATGGVSPRGRAAPAAGPLAFPATVRPAAAVPVATQGGTAGGAVQDAAAVRHRWLAVEAYLIEQPPAAESATLWAGALSRGRDAVLVFAPPAGAGGHGGADGRAGHAIPPMVFLNLELREAAGGLRRCRLTPSPALGESRKRQEVKALLAEADWPLRPLQCLRRTAETVRRDSRLLLWVCSSARALCDATAWQRLGSLHRPLLPVIDARGSLPVRHGPGVPTPFAYLLADEAVVPAILKALTSRPPRVVAAVPGNPALSGGPPVSLPGSIELLELFGGVSDVLAVYADRAESLVALKRASSDTGASGAVGRAALLAAHWALWGGNFGLARLFLGMASPGCGDQDAGGGK